MSESEATLTFIMSEQSLFSLNFLKIGRFLKVKVKTFGVTNKGTQKAENSHLFNERENERKSNIWE